MKLSERTISKIAELITGNDSLSPYKTGPRLVKLFNEVGNNDIYGDGFPSRQTYVEDNLRRLNSPSKLKELLRVYLDPREFIETPGIREKIIDEINKYLKFDDYVIGINDDGFVELKSQKENVIVMESEDKIGKDYISEQLRKCKGKLDSKDFSGAITNARTLIEEILLEIIKEKTGERVKNDGDLLKLFKIAQESLNLDPSATDINNTIKQILQGLVSIVNGLASMRNKMSDAHSSSYRADKHHAKLAINCAVTLADFLFDTHEFQLSKIKNTPVVSPVDVTVWGEKRYLGYNQCECSLISGLFPGGVVDGYDIEGVLVYEHCDTCNRSIFICNNCGPITNINLGQVTKCPGCDLAFITDGENIKIISKN